MKARAANYRAGLASGKTIIFAKEPAARFRFIRNAFDINYPETGVTARSHRPRTPTWSLIKVVFGGGWSATLGGHVGHEKQSVPGAI
jgi:hypothetical protein